MLAVMFPGVGKARPGAEARTYLRSKGKSNVKGKNKMRGSFASLKDYS
jgi:hypothetical protein